ncbi:hypothetical protein LOTGIDRAFT_232331 [Lottia gigantea]|uniref:Uncharacterized protein n=1 Tax=Lottia gigantea TaxID=225164 RepID=V4BZC4_LOTGI|nr:hypothetical protein LOTGIDRAFT_232331 [Lottia gigantea]ESO94494.1 hypothetical protein LOTGIDRAFT_232331 [Lottia gigantea]
MEISALYIVNTLCIGLAYTVCMIVYINCEKCTYTQYCKIKFQSQASNLGHEKEEFCKLIIHLDRCIEVERPKCAQGLTDEVDRFLQGLYDNDPECSGVPSLEFSVVILISSLVLIFNI